MVAPTPMHKEVELYRGTTLAPRDLVAKVPVPRFAGGHEPDVIIWGNRVFKRSGDVNENLDWKYLECFAYTVPEIVDG